MLQINRLLVLGRYRNLLARRGLEEDLLARRRDAGDGLELGLELRDGPRGGDSSLGSGVVRDYIEGHICHGRKESVVLFGRFQAQGGVKRW